MMAQTYLDKRFPKAVFRYRITVAVSLNFTIVIYFLLVGYSPLLLDAWMPGIVQLANSVGPQVAKTLVLATVFLAALPIPVLVQIGVVRFASSNPALLCPYCAVFIASKDSIKAIRKYGTCPTCGTQLIPEEEVGVEPYEQKRLPILY
jgi:hypothetical protein